MGGLKSTACMLGRKRPYGGLEMMWELALCRYRAMKLLRLARVQQSVCRQAACQRRPVVEKSVYSLGGADTIGMYDANVSVHSSYPFVRVLLEQLGIDELLEGEHDAVFTSDADCGASILYCFDGVFDLVRHQLLPERAARAEGELPGNCDHRARRLSLTDRSQYRLRSTQVSKGRIESVLTSYHGCEAAISRYRAGRARMLEYNIGQFEHRETMRSSRR